VARSPWSINVLGVGIGPERKNGFLDCMCFIQNNFFSPYGFI
jgi:hypothetical protein